MKKLIKDIVIPAGTIFQDAPQRTERFGDGHIQATIGLTDNTTGDVTYFVGDDQEKLRKWFQDVS